MIFGPAKYQVIPHLVLNRIVLFSSGLVYTLEVVADNWYPSLLNSKHRSCFLICNHSPSAYSVYYKINLVNDLLWTWFKMIYYGFRFCFYKDLIIFYQPQFLMKQYLYGISRFLNLFLKSIKSIPFNQSQHYQHPWILHKEYSWSYVRPTYVNIVEFNLIC